MKSLKVLIIALLLITLTGCTNKIEKIYLSDEFYNQGKFIKIKSEEINNYKDKNYVLFTYNNFCSLPTPCDEIFESFMKNNKIDFVSIPFEEFKKTELYKKVKYAPSIIVISNNKIVTYLDADKDSDLDKYQNEESFKEWLSQYIYLEKN